MSVVVEWPASLSAEQIAELKASAILPGVAVRMGVHGINDASAAAKLLGRRPKDWEGHLPCLVYPYYVPGERDPVLWRGKPSVPFESVNPKNGKTELAKYVQARNTGTQIWIGPSILFGDAATNVSIPIIGTEGEKKGLAGESAGFSVIALPGVHQWHVKGSRYLHATLLLIEWDGREFFTGFDADALQNAEVRAQERDFGRAIQKRGATVATIRFPADAPKLDDFLARYPREDLLQLMDDARKRGKLRPDRSAEEVGKTWAPIVEKLRLDPKSGQPVCDVDTIVRVLQLHPDWQGVLAFDARNERQVFRAQPPFSSDVAIAKQPIPRPLIDSDPTRVGEWLVAQSALGWSSMPKLHVLEAALAIVCERARFDAVAEYLKGLKWDGEARLDGMGAAYFGADDDDYTRAVFSKWVLSAVARARTPGCQVDHTLVLEGGQGLGKSTALRILAGDAFFSDTLPELGRDAHDHCIGPWVIELAELDHVRKSEVTALKAFLTARAPRFRSAYGRRSVDHARRCVFVATTNESTYLADATGNRRFWPVAVRTVDLVGIARDRDQLWAEAVARVRAGEQWHLDDPKVVALASEQQAMRRQADPWEAPIAAFVRDRKTVTVTDVLDYLGQGGEATSAGFGGPYVRPSSSKASRLQHDQRSANRVAAILVELGMVRSRLRTEGGRVYHYVRPEPDVRQPGQRSGRSQAETRDTGATVDPTQPVESAAKSPPSPVSPDETANPTCAHVAREGEVRPFTRAPAPSSDQYTGDTRDTGDNSADSSTYPGPTPAPHDVHTGDTAPDNDNGLPDFGPRVPRKVY